VFASASTVIATMLPIIIMGGGISKLIGFAVTILLGTLIGILVARPVYSQIARRILLSDEEHTSHHE
jgi:preprotein translocase subunit SecD